MRLRGGIRAQARLWCACVGLLMLTHTPPSACAQQQGHIQTEVLVGASAGGDAAMPAAAPEDVGLSSTKLDRITKKLEGLVKKGALPGCSLVVARGGKKVYTANIGFADMEMGLPYRADTISRILSQTKPVTAAATLILIDEGKVSLTDPLYKYDNRFKGMKVMKEVDDNGNVVATESAQRDITIYDLLTFTSGLSYSYDFMSFGDQQGPIDFPDFTPVNALELSTMDLPQFMGEVAKLPLPVQPGSGFHYGWSMDVLGYVIQKVTGQPPDVFISNRVFRPLNMTDTGFFVPMEKMLRFAAEYTYDDKGQLSTFLRPRLDVLQGYRTPKLILGGAGVVSTANDYMRFAQMLLNGGQLGGVRILSEHAVDLMWRNHLTPSQLPYGLNGWTSDPDTGYGFGVAITVPVKSVQAVNWDAHTGAKRTGDIGWGGGATTSWQASADEDMVATFMTQVIPPGEGLEVFDNTIWPGIYDAITGPSPRKANTDTAAGTTKMRGPKAGINYEGNRADARRERREQKKRDRQQRRHDTNHDDNSNNGDHRALRRVSVTVEPGV